MFSIIISSINEQQLQSLCDNIAATAGAEYELLVYQNKEGKGLCEVYNTQASKAKYGLLCFVHEDVLFHTQDWCGQIKKSLRNNSIGVVGIMGSRYKSFFGTGWRDGDPDFFRMNVKDGLEDGRLLTNNPAGKNHDEVICLDGAFLCCTKSHWQAHPFDEITFTGFHYYDLDFSLAMHTAGLKNIVTFDVLIEHFSQGKRDLNFLNEFLRFQKKWQLTLPQSTQSLSEKQTAAFEGYALAETLWLMKKKRFSAKERWRQLQQYQKRHKRFYHLLRSFYFGFLK